MDGLERQPADEFLSAPMPPTGDPSDILALLAGDTPPDEVLLHVAVAAERIAPGTSCAILRVDDDGKRLLPGAAPRYPAPVLQRIHAVGVGPNQGLCGTAAFRRAPVFMPDFRQEHIDPELAAAAAALDVAGGWACPLINRGGQLLGTFSILFAAGAVPAEMRPETYRLPLQLALVVLEHDRRGRAAASADRRLVALAQNVPGVLYQRIVEPDGGIRYTFISDGVKDLFGVTAEEVVADPAALFSRYGREYASTFRERLRAASRALSMWDVEAVVDTPDGERRYTHAIARPEPLPDGSVVWNGVILDNTRTKKAELAAAASEARTREAIIESISEAICLFDQADRLITCNSRFLEMYPSAREVAAAGATYADVARAEMSHYVDEADLEWRLSDRLEMHKLPSFTTEQRTRDGRSLLASERRSADGSTVILFTDITELRRREEERSLLQEQFYRAQKMQAVGRLAGGIAHDFNNILAAILGNAHFLIEDLPGDSEQHEFAEHIFAAAERAKNLVQQILAFSRQQAPEQDLLAPDALVEEAAQLLRATLPKTIQLVIEGGAAGLKLRGNQTQLVQVLMNLCVNARDAIGDAQGAIRLAMAGPVAAAQLPELPATEKPIPAADGRIEVQVGSFEPAARYVRITVSDTGGGIDAAVMERMFEPFYTTKDIGRGTGLGLSAVHGIVADHKGAMLVTSRPGEGTSFELFFPLDGAAADADSDKGAALPAGSERILVVDDEAQIARTTAKLLERLGYRPTAFSNPAEALAAFEAAPEEWGLVVTDQTMPQLTGIELAHKMLSRRPDLPIILCSGFGLGLNDASIRALGLRAFLPKPVDQGQLARAVRSGIDRRPG